VCELGDDLDLARGKRSPPLCLRELGPQDLEGDRAGVLEVTRQVYGGHAALTYFAFNRVGLGKGASDLLEGSHSRRENYGLVQRWARRMAVYLMAKRSTASSFWPLNLHVGESACIERQSLPLLLS